MELFNYFRSSASFRVRIALGLKQLPYDYVPVHIARGEHKVASFQAVSPAMLVPALLPITSRSVSELVPSRLAPWIDAQPHSPAA